MRGFPGGPLVRTLFSLPRTWVQALVREQKDPTSWGSMAKIIKIKSCDYQGIKMLKDPERSFAVGEDLQA